MTRNMYILIIIIMIIIIIIYIYTYTYMYDIIYDTCYVSYMLL